MGLAEKFSLSGKHPRFSPLEQFAWAQFTKTLFQLSPSVESIHLCHNKTQVWLHSLQKKTPTDQHIRSKIFETKWWEGPAEFLRPVALTHPCDPWWNPSLSGASWKTYRLLTIALHKIIETRVKKNGDFLYSIITSFTIPISLTHFSNLVSRSSYFYFLSFALSISVHQPFLPALVVNTYVLKLSPISNSFII